MLYSRGNSPRRSVLECGGSTPPCRCGARLAPHRVAGTVRLLALIAVPEVNCGSALPGATGLLFAALFPTPFSNNHRHYTRPATPRPANISIIDTHPLWCSSGRPWPPCRWPSPPCRAGSRVGRDAAVVCSNVLKLFFARSL